MNRGCSRDALGSWLLSHSDTYLTCLLWQVTCSPLIPCAGSGPWSSHSWTTVPFPSYIPGLLHFSTPINWISSFLAIQSVLLFSLKNLSVISHPYFHKSHFLIISFQFLNDHNLLSVHPHQTGIFMWESWQYNREYVSRKTSLSELQGLKNKCFNQCGILSRGMNILEQIC